MIHATPLTPALALCLLPPAPCKQTNPAGCRLSQGALAHGPSTMPGEACPLTLLLPSYWTLSSLYTGHCSGCSSWPGSRGRAPRPALSLCTSWVRQSCCMLCLYALLIFCPWLFVRNAGLLLCCLLATASCLGASTHQHVTATGQHVVPTAVGFTLALGTAPSISQHSHPTLPTAGWICRAGPQKEVQQWPLFLELGCLHPALRLHLHFVGPEVPLSADGLSLEVPSPVGRSCGAAGCSCQRAAAAPGLAEGQQAAGVDGGRQAQQGGSTRLMWHRGLYHGATAALISGSGPPDLVVGANAGGWEHGVCFCATFKSCP